MNLLVLTVAPVALLLTALARWLPPRGRQVCAAAAALVVAGALLLAIAAPPAPGVGGAGRALLAVVAVAGGGPVIATLLDGLQQPGEEPAQVLRGGAWIGVLERTAVFVAVVGGFAEAVAIVVAVKGLGRYPELQSDAGKGAAERFIAGTLASLLWAGACALLSLA